MRRDEHEQEDRTNKHTVPSGVRQQYVPVRTEGQTMTTFVKWRDRDGREQSRQVKVPLETRTTRAAPLHTPGVT